MDIGLALPQFDFSVPGERPLRGETLLGWGERAEALGFASVWLADHLFLEITKYGGPPGCHGSFDPLVALGALARRTSRVRLGTLALCAQLRPPAVLAKALTTLDALSGGRLTVTMGAGWFEPEYHVAGIDFERPAVRLEQLAEVLQILRGMLGSQGQPFSFSGKHYSCHRAPCLPPPVQRPHPPLWVGGRGDRLLELVAHHADGWNTVWAQTPEQYRERLAVVEAACERVDRDPATVTRSLGLYALVGESEADLTRRWERLQRLSPPGVVDGVTLGEWRRDHLVGTVEQVGEQLATWAELGVSTFVVGAGALAFSIASPDDVELLATACSLATNEWHRSP